MVQENQSAILSALHLDLAKPALECLVAEIGSAIERAVKSAKLLKEWAEPVSVEAEVPEWQKGWSPIICKIPKGVVLIIS